MFYFITLFYAIYTDALYVFVLLVLSAFEQLRLCNLMMKDQSGLLRVCTAPDSWQLMITANGFWQASSKMGWWPGWHASFCGQITSREKKKTTKIFGNLLLFFFFFSWELSLKDFLNFSSWLEVRYWRMQVLFAEEENGTLKIRSDNGRHFWLAEAGDARVICCS